MDIFLSTIFIFLEVLILAAVTYAVLNGVRLTVFDLGVSPKYNRAVTMVFIAVGVIILVFFIAHLTAWYPAI